MESEVQPTQKRGRGRPPSGVPRKEQIRQAVQKHRNKARFGGGELIQVEISSGLCFAIREVASREGVTLKEAVTRLLERGWREDYLETEKEKDPTVARKVADSMIARWREMHSASFQKPEGA